MIRQTGTSSDDTLSGTVRVRFINGGEEIIVDDNFDDEIFGRQGNDQISGLGGNDYLYGEQGNDTLLGGEGNDHLYGGADNDVLEGGRGADVLAGGAGNDTYIIRSWDNPSGGGIIEQNVHGYDTIRVYRGSFAMPSNVEKLVVLTPVGWSSNPAQKTDFVGNNSDNLMEGNDLDNILRGQEGNDSLYGESGNDSLSGGKGGDLIVGGRGEDFITGQAFGLLNNGGVNVLWGDDRTANPNAVRGDADKFFFELFEPENVHIIKDFRWLEGDKIELGQAFQGASKTQLSYNRNTGILSFDPEGSVGLTPFLKLDNRPVGFSINLDINIEP
ncbi:MAG: calcium-binding protein [Cyanobacteria bacterium J06635_15]